MKKILFLIFISFGMLSSLFGADRMYGKGQGFIGAQAGFVGIADFSVGAVGGYQYYFQNDWQFAGFRHGIRGIGNIDLAKNNSSLFSIGAGVDWTIEFTPDSKYNWGAFAGLGLIYINGKNYIQDPIALNANIGGSLNIDNTHKLELSFGSGLSLIAFRYLYMF